MPKSIERPTYENDIHRPQFHFLPAANWMNDPNGVIQWEGRYHLFYQYNPDGAYHANMHWGHAVSDDMIHWEELPIALTPTPGSYDQGGIFSGCIIDDNGIPTALYTGVNDDYSVQIQCLAVGSPDLLTWQKPNTNPIIGSTPTAMGQTGDFRDPFVWQEVGGWYMVVGSRIEGVGGVILLYRSDNLTDWDYLHPIFVGENARNGVMFECPNLFKLGDKWVLIISSHIGHTTGTVLYFVGDYQNHKFTPEVEGVFDAGYYYAPLSHVDDQGRRIMWAWLREGRNTTQQKNAGWSGVQAIPRILTLDDNNRLQMTPIPELEQLRKTHHHFSAEDIHAPNLPLSGLSFDIQASFVIDTGAPCGIEVACSSDGEEKTAIYYDASTETLRVVRHYSQPSESVDTYVQGLPHHLTPDETLDLRIILDGSVLEIIANHRTSITSRIYPTQSNSKHLRIINPSSVQTLDLWEMSSIWS